MRPNTFVFRAPLILWIFITGCNLDININGTSISSIPSSSTPSPRATGGPQILIMSKNNVGSAAGVTVDSQSNVYYTDDDNQVIRKIPQGGASTLFVNIPDAYLLSHDGNDNVYSAPWGDGSVFKVTPSGVVSALGSFNPYPTGFTADMNGNLYFTSASGSISQNMVKKMTPSGVVYTFAGSASAGFINANGTLARFSDPQGLTVDLLGNVYVVDAGNSVIRKITPEGDVTTVAGSGIRGTQNGPAMTASFSFRSPGEQPTGIGISPLGDIFVGQGYSDGILRKISNTGIVSDYCGDRSRSGEAIPGPCIHSPFYQTGSVAVGPDGSIYYNDGYRSIVKISN